MCCCLHAPELGMAVRAADVVQIKPLISETRSFLYWHRFCIQPSRDLIARLQVALVISPSPLLFHLCQIYQFCLSEPVAPQLPL